MKKVKIHILLNMISKKAKYALKALKVLAERYAKGPVLISEIAEKERIPKLK